MAGNTAEAERSEIEAVIQTYLDGLYEGDAEKLAAAFHPTSALTQWFDDKLMITPRNDWLEMVRNRASPKASGLERRDRVLLIDITSPGMALVKLECAIQPRFFTDQLSLLKIEGRWQIVQKVFATDVRTAQ